jgi:tRNA threonylcarbamoyl adenosine modification protein (Sua5/YciO/YrdC/YwlC family)
MLLRVHPDNPQPRQIKAAVDCLQRGGIIIYPTDTIYGLGCDILQQKAIENICRIKNVDPKKAQLSFICPDLSHLSEYAKQIPNSTYRLLKEYRITKLPVQL